MKNLLIIIITFINTLSNTTEFQISISSLRESDKPYPVIILTNKNVNEAKFPKHYYKIEQRDLEKIEKQSSLRGKEKQVKLLLIEIKKDNKVKKYFFNKKEGINILNSIQKQTSHYNDESLTEYLLYLQKVTAY